MKILVIGAAGRMGSMHVRHLRELGHKVIPFDLAPGENAIVGTPWDADCDAAVIATPANLHLQDLQGAISSGRHVFIEKPICLIGETTQARALLKRAEAAGLIVAVGYNLRFHPKVMAIRNQIASGWLKPLWGSFLLRQKPQRLLAYFPEEWASHEVDLALHLMGPPRLRDSRQLFYDGAEIRLDIEHDIDDFTHSFVHADALTDPPRRAFTIVDQDGRSITCDIETDHVQDDHYKAEIAAWIEWIRIARENDFGPAGPLASGRDGVAAIEVLERLTK